MMHHPPISIYILVLHLGGRRKADRRTCLPRPRCRGTTPNKVDRVSECRQGAGWVLHDDDNVIVCRWSLARERAASLLARLCCRSSTPATGECLVTRGGRRRDGGRQRSRTVCRWPVPGDVYLARLSACLSYRLRILQYSMYVCMYVCMYDLPSAGN
ncbi:hypothetical protein LZ31DRAFT_168918 [Colletotrichum somersetense]|nr:hypothetical protein LZ31DRAFT_168918 [Colletotrichum somersetense]